MLKLRRATVVADDPLAVRLDGDPGGKARRAWADEALVGPCRPGDEVVVNTEALDLGLGSGGFDVVHVNLTRGLTGEGSATEHVMKLNYSSLQHPVATVERPVDDPEGATAEPVPVLAIGLHGHLAPAAWAFAEQAGRGLSLGYVQTGGGALPGSLSRDVTALLDRGLLAGHLTAGPAYGGLTEAITLIGALDAAASLGWDAVVAGPGPGILGSDTRYGHGGMAALDVLHATLALGGAALLSARLSSGDPRARHQGLSHHSRAVLDLCLGPVEVPLPEGAERLLGGAGAGLDLERTVGGLGGGGHVVVRAPAELGRYGESGLPRRTMGRDLDEDPAFFAAPLAAGRRLAERAAR